MAQPTPSPFPITCAVGGGADSANYDSCSKRFLISLSILSVIALVSFSILKGFLIS